MKINKPYVKIFSGYDLKLEILERKIVFVMSG